MSGLTDKAVLDTQGLRERNVSIQTNGDEEARKAVLHLNALEEKAEKQDKDKKTFGRTPDGIGKENGHRSATPDMLQLGPILALGLHLEKLMHSIQSSQCRTHMTWSHNYCLLPNPRTFQI